MYPVFLLRFNVQEKDAVAGVLSGLGVLTVETIYIVFVFLLGINLFRRGSFYQLVKRAGEENRTDSQAANVIGTAIYTALSLMLLPLVRTIARKLFGG